MKTILLCTFLFTFHTAVAQTRSLPVSKISVPPVIDGYGNDEAWKNTVVADQFLQREPVDAAPETERTEFRLAYDETHLYVYAMMYDSRPDSIVARLARRDDIPESDWFGIGFDSYFDRQTAFVFIVLASGTKADNLTYNDGRDEDYSWDPVWQAETRILPNGWSTEMKIPLSQIRFAEGNDTWGMNVARRISRKQEETNWNLMSKQKDGVVSQFGTMTGMKGVKFTNAVEVLPYAVGASEHYPQRNNREKIETIRPNAGVDIKYGVTSNFTLDATVNPDFAQVEADPAVLNLTTFETFYPEKRPFFIEGTQILRFVTFGGDFGPGLFYSRRIGRPIGVRLPSDGVIITDEPRTATILGAAKFSGKTESGTSIGLLTGLTQEENFSYRDTLGAIKTVRAEPSASYNLFRVKQDFWGNSNVGAIVTGTARESAVPAYTLGTDWDVKLDSNNYRVNGFLAVSHGTKYIDKFARIRQQPFLQQGSAGKVNVARVSGNWTYGAGYDFTSRKYFINDIGFFRSPNDYGVGVNGGYRTFTPGVVFRSYNVNGNIHLRWNYDRMTLFREASVGAGGQFLNFWSISGGLNFASAAQNPYEPRGYGVLNNPSSFFARLEVESDSRQPVIVNVEENIRTFDNGALSTNTQAFMIVRPTSSMEYQLSVSYGTERKIYRFIQPVIDTAVIFAAVTPAAVIGESDVDGFDVTLRSSVLFTSDLSLQIYNQFFWAKGQYKNFSLLRPDRTLMPYGYSGNNDFNSTSLNSNVVLRWEYREGSTFYFVWSHGRGFFQNGGFNTDLATNVENTFLRTAPDNVYVVKVSYWMSL